MKPHKHSEIIKAWADGAEIEKQNQDGTWVDMHRSWPWYEDWVYRIKPKSKPDVVFSTHIEWDFGWQRVNTTSTKRHNLKMIFDAETGELKSAEVCK